MACYTCTLVHSQSAHSYTIFNICLYATQLIMYTLLFVNTHAVASGNIIDILNLIIALLNYSLPGTVAMKPSAPTFRWTD